MALIKCEECDNEVSEKASSCPKCGNPMAVDNKHSEILRVKTSEDSALTRNRNGGDILLFLILVPVIVFFLFMISRVI